MTGAVFLSAGMPDPVRGPDYAATADPVAITSAISALVHVVLGRRLLVFGGHPAITPMIWVMAEHLGVQYGSWVRLYQSLYFADQFPEDNERYQNTVFTPSRENLASSLATMREQMFADQRYEAAVFVGGMKGIEDEFALLRLRQPATKMVPIASTGGAALVLARSGMIEQSAVQDSLDYVMYLHERLGISPKELRYETPDLQPPDIADRMWRSS